MTQNLSKSLLLACLISLSATAQMPTEIIQTQSGKVQGLVIDGVEAFKGIPFAAAPIGELRWRAPQAAKSWDDTLQATDFGNDCLQTPFPGDEAPLRTVGSEDCLTLNIWRQTAMTAPLPVMVWLYGGGLVNGGTSPAIYDGAQFANKGVIFVSANYRIGRFGFFAHPALTAEHPDEVKNNYGFLDQQAALQWVKDNIAQFGGDPNNITLFGESAGGFSIHTHLTTPLTKRLFHKVIIQSGGGRDLIGGKRLLNQATTENPISAEQAGINFAKRFGITGQDETALEALRALPASAIVSGLHMKSIINIK